MKKLLFITIAVLAIAFVVYLRQNSVSFIDNSNNIENTNVYSPQDDISYVFIPYWSFTDSIEVQEYDNLIYFGVSIDENGLDEDDEAYRGISSFSELVSSDKKKYLTLRIIGDSADGKILENGGFQEKVGEELADVAEEYDFDGVVIDYETSAFGFASTEKKITNLYKTLEGYARENNLEYLVTLFGDTYYRARPYNVREISSISDKIIIMAYDFHKARLNPGPNFPLSNNNYGYDLKNMISDFRNDVDHEKIVVTLGYFGYNWELNSNGINTGVAKSLSLNQIRSSFINDCPVENCRMEQTEDLEKVIKYENEEGNSHEVWFEDEKSINKKINFLESEGINQISYWAYSYY